MGFSAAQHPLSSVEKREVLAKVEPEDLLGFGYIPELIGRLPMTTVLEELTEEQLVSILTEPRNALVRQYRKLFEMEGAELEFTPGSLREIARMAKERDTGARGLRSIVEELMTEIMYELPEMEQKEKYQVTDAVVRGEKPMFEKTPVADKKSA